MQPLTSRFAAYHESMKMQAIPPMTPVPPLPSHPMYMWGYPHHGIMSPPSPPMVAPRRNNNRTSMCYTCGQKGHVSRECTRFKTRICKFWMNNCCNSGNADGTNSCIFAHGDSELRVPATLYCIRIIHDNGTVSVEGCGVSGHRFAECPVGGINVSPVPPPPPLLPPLSPPPQLPCDDSTPDCEPETLEGIMFDTDHVAITVDVINNTVDSSHVSTCVAESVLPTYASVLGVPKEDA
jgi:hypothetical protein